MRRLQCNLAYLAATADRSHKPSSQIPAHPAIMSAPPPPPKPSTSSPVSPPTPKNEPKQTEAEAEERAGVIGDLYRRLQALFPGVDPKTEPVSQAARAQQQMQQLQQQKMQQNQMAQQGQAMQGQQGAGR